MRARLVFHFAVLSSLLLLPGAAARVIAELAAWNGPVFPVDQARGSGTGVPVTLPFRVLDGDRPVLDLRPDEVSLEVDGRPRRLTDLQLVEVEGGRSRGALIAPPFATNSRSDEGRDILFLVDDESIAPGRERSLRIAAERLLDGLAPNDRVAFGIVRDVDAGVPSTANQDRVRAGLEAARGRARGVETAEDVSCRTRQVLHRLDASFRNVAGATPATIVFFSTSLLPPSEATAQIGMPSDLCEVRLDDFNKLAALARTAPVDYYVVHVVDGMPAGSTLAMEAGLQSLAGSTGGEFIRVSGDNEAGLTRVVRETSAFYRATFESEGVDERAVHRINLRVDRKGVKVRVQQELVGAQTGPTAPANAPAARDMLRVARIYRDLPLRATAYSSRQADDDRIKVTVVFEAADGTPNLKSAAVGLFDRTGKPVAQWTGRPAELKSAPTMAALVAPPGAYRLRVVATDESGRGATIDDEIWVGLASAGGMRFSGLALGVPQGRSFAPALRFRTEPAAIGYMEIYGAAQNARLSVIFEVKAAENIPAILTVPATVNTASDAEDVRLVIGVIPIASLPAGDLLVRAVVSVDGQVVGRATRTLRKADR